MQPNIFDISNYIIHKLGSMTAMKLQKLVYYCQAWSIVWDEEELFKEKIYAWANSPIVKELYNACNGEFKINKEFEEGNINNLSDQQKNTIDEVLKFYGDKSSQYLSDLVRSEMPWKTARNGLPEGERGNNAITSASIEEYYSSLIYL